MKTLKRVLTYVRKNLALLLLGLVFSVIGISLSLYSPIVIGKAIDVMVGAGKVDFGIVAKSAVTVTVCVVLSSLFQWIMTLCMNRVTFQSMHTLRAELFHKINELPLAYLDTHSRGDMLNRIVDDVEQISTGMIQAFTQFFSGIVTILTTFFFMVSVSAKATVVVVVLTPLSIVVAWLIARSTQKMFTHQNKLRGRLSGYAEEMIAGGKTMKAFHYEDTAQEKFDEINHELKIYGFRAQFYSSITNPSTRFVNGLVYTATGVFGALLALNGKLTIGQISSFLTYANQYTKPFNEVTSVMAELQNALSSAGRVFRVLDAESEKSDAGLPELVFEQGRVELCDVEFSYRKDQDFIRNLNVEVKSGQRIALVGPTGCGKTTIINLLMRFYDINNGEILIDGTPIDSVTRSSLRSHFGMVLQDSWLFAGTVHENIAYGKPDATRQEVVEAGKLAYAHSFITRMEHGYDTKITENAGNLSSGQKQLLSIARIMLTKPSMLILDEATSNIDTRTETQIGEAFEHLLSGRTSFVVAHRLSTIQNADVILVMKAGKIIERGTHEELLAKGGLYKELYSSQFESSAV